MTDEEIAQTVATHGWQALNIGDHEPPFMYTCGLMTTFTHPELIIFGLAAEVAHALLSAMVDDLGKGGSYAEPRAYKLRDKIPLAIRSVHPTQHELYLGFAMAHCRYMGHAGGLAARQVFWPDDAGRFPFDKDCDESTWRLQPRLDQEIPPAELEEFRARWNP